MGVGVGEGVGVGPGVGGGVGSAGDSGGGGGGGGGGALQTTLPFCTPGDRALGLPGVPSTNSLTVTARALEEPPAPTQSKVSVATTTDPPVTAGIANPAACAGPPGAFGLQAPDRAPVLQAVILSTEGSNPMLMSAAPNPVDGRPAAVICTTFPFEPASKLQLPPETAVAWAETADPPDMTASDTTAIARAPARTSRRATMQRGTTGRGFLASGDNVHLRLQFGARSARWFP